MRPTCIFIAALLLSCSVAFSQKHNLVRTKLSNLLYIGLDNLVTIYKKTDDFQVSIKNGTITPIDTKNKDSVTYFIKVDKSESKPILTIKQGKEVMTYSFRKREIPNPEFVLHATSVYTPVTQNVIPLSYFRKILGVVLSLNNFDFDVAMKVKSFGITIISKNGDRKQFECIEQDISKYTYMAQENDIYIFHDIVITIITSGEDRILKDQIYQIKTSE